MPFGTRRKKKKWFKIYISKSINNGGKFKYCLQKFDSFYELIEQLITAYI